MESYITGQQPAYTLRGQQPVYTVRGQQPVYTVREQQPVYTIRGQQPAYTLNGQQPAYTLNGQQPAYTLHGQQPAHFLHGQQPSHFLHGQQPAHTLNGQQPAHTLNGQQPAHTLNGQQPAHILHGQQPAHTLHGQQPAHSSRGQQAAIRDAQEMGPNPPCLFFSPPMQRGPLHWEYRIFGPQGTPYAGGYFYLQIFYPPEYPERQPRVQFTTPIFHPNIDSSGRIPLHLIYHDWAPRHGTRGVLSKIVGLLLRPQRFPPKNTFASFTFNHDHPYFVNIAVGWTRRYATRFGALVKFACVIVSWFGLFCYEELIKALIIIILFGKF